MYYRIQQRQSLDEQLILKQTSIQQLQKKGECVPPALLASISSVKMTNVPTLGMKRFSHMFKQVGVPHHHHLFWMDQRHRSRSKPEKYPSDFWINPFPITQDIIDQIPVAAKKSETRFVASLLRLMYTENYLGAHTMAANLTGKKNMDENELCSIICELYISVYTDDIYITFDMLLTCYIYWNQCNISFLITSVLKTFIERDIRFFPIEGKRGRRIAGRAPP